MQSAFKLMSKKGFAATRVDEICKLAEASKGSFYHCFSSKEEIGIAAIAWWYEKGSDRLLGGPYQTEPDPVQRMYGLLNYTRNISDSIWGQGGLIGTFAVELAEVNPEMQRRVAGLFSTSSSRFAAAFEIVPELVPDSPTAQQLGEHFVQLLEGAVVMGKAYNRPEMIKQAIEFFQKYLEGLLRRV